VRLVFPSTPAQDGGGNKKRKTKKEGERRDRSAGTVWALCCAGRAPVTNPARSLLVHPRHDMTQAPDVSRPHGTRRSR
jgi:hypothetical protein